MKRDYKIETEKVTSLTQKYNDLKDTMEENIKQLKQDHFKEMDLQKKEYKTIIDDLRDSLAKIKGNSLKDQENHIDEIQQLRTKIREYETELNSFKILWNQKDLLLKSEISKNEEISQQLSSLKDTLK